MNRLEHLMTIFSEECAEIIQANSKALRFGCDEVRDTGANNVTRVREEFNDMLALVRMLEAEGLDLSVDLQWQEYKISKVEHYLEHSRNCGTLTE